MIPSIGFIIGVYVLIRLIQMGSVSHFSLDKNGNFEHKPAPIVSVICIIGAIIVVFNLINLFLAGTQAPGIGNILG